MTLLKHIALLLFAFNFAACSNSNDHPQDQPAQGNAQLTPDNSEGGVYTPDVESLPEPKVPKDELRAQLAKINQEYEAAKKIAEPLERLTHLQYLTSRTILVAAQAYDREGDYLKQIKDYRKRFTVTPGSEALASNLQKTMLGLYSAYALMYSIRFDEREERMKILESLRDNIEQKMKPEIPLIDAMAEMAVGSYKLLSDIMKDIDAEGRYKQSFEQSEQLFKQGTEVATSEEDHYLNGVFRMYEITKLWANLLNADATKELAGMQAKMIQRQDEADDIGQQMSRAMEDLFLLSRKMTEYTIDITYK